MDAKTHKVLVVFGTRPEAIKLAPVIERLRGSDVLDVSVCVTGQHRQMLDQVLSVFGIRPDRDLRLMEADQDLFQLTSRMLIAMQRVLREELPDLLLVQGDTTTTFAAALAAYYASVPVAHVEAGLRTGDRRNPFPEEINRRTVTLLADWHFAPTPRARDHLLRDGVSKERVWVTGNTIVDALLAIRERASASDPALEELIRGNRLILVTSHRRESFGAGLEEICHAVLEITRLHSDTIVVYPVHLNPRVRGTVERELGERERIHLVEPLDYLAFVRLVQRAHFIVTDSGGVQEEAPTFGVPVLVVRETTERPEGIEAGVARLVGTSAERIVRAANWLLTDSDAHAKTAQIGNPYGDGHAAERIVAVLEQVLEARPSSRIPRL